MDAYKKKLRRRTMACAACMVLMAALFFTLHSIDAGWKSASDGDAHHMLAFLSGYRLGFLGAIELLFLLVIIRNVLALRSEKMLRGQYIRETDERSVLIWRKCRAASLKIVTIVLASATIAAGYYDKTVFFTLVCTIYLIGMTIGLTRLYYAKKLK